MAVVKKFNVNKQQVTLDADIIENMSANDVSYNSSLQYDENTVGDKLSELEKKSIEIYDKVGWLEKEESYTQADFQHIIWNGTKFVESNVYYDGFYVNLEEGQTISFSYEGGSKGIAAVFYVKPIVGVIADRIINNIGSSYKASQYCYILFTFDLRSEIPTTVVYKDQCGIVGDISILTETVGNYQEDSIKQDAINTEFVKRIEDTECALGKERTIKLTNLSNIIWDGENFIKSNKNYNSFVIKVNAQQSYTILNYTGTIANYRFSETRPEIGVSASMVNKVITETNIAEKDGYVMVTFNMNADTPMLEMLLSESGIYFKVSTLQDNVENDSQSIKNIINEIGEDATEIELTDSDFANLIWDGTKLVASNVTYNGFVIPIYEGQHITYKATGANNLRTFSSLSKVGSIDYVRVGSELKGDFYVQKNEKYLFINCTVATYSGYVVTKTAIGMKRDVSSIPSFKNSTIVFLGDSCVEGVGADNGRGNGFPKYIQDKFGGNIINGGVGGTRFTPRKYQHFEDTDPERYANYYAYHQMDILSLVKAIESGNWENQIYAANWLKENVSHDRVVAINELSNLDWNKVDAIVFNAASNDWSSNTPFGEDSSTESTDFCGALNEIIRLLNTKYPKIRLFFITNGVRYWLSKIDEEWCDIYQNGIGKTLKDYVDLTIQICNKWHIPYYDLYRLGGFNQFNFSTYFIDIAHPGHGYKIMADKIGGYLIGEGLN